MRDATEMNRIRYMAAGLLCVTGMLHMARLGLTEPPAILIEVFGVVYLLIGGLLFLNKKVAYYLAAIAPLIGLFVGPAILTNVPIMVAAFFGGIDIVVVASCFYLIKTSRMTREPS